MENTKEVKEVKEVRFLRKPVDLAKKSVAFILGNGQSLTLSLDEIPPATVEQLALHGLSQKAGDAAAGCAKDKAYGHALTCINDVLENLKKGFWGVEREPTGNQDLIAAIAQLKNLPTEAVQAAVVNATPDQLKGWMKNARIAKVMAELKAERLAKVADADETEFEFEV